QAVECLNSLQTNAAIIEAINKTGGSANSRSLPEMREFCRKIGYEVDVAIMEVGIGGEYDSTNIIEKPTVCGVSSLGIDHQRYLGETIDSIAWHKGGIFKANIPAVTVDQPAIALDVLKKRAKDVNVRLAGQHQLINASLAIELCRIWLEKHRNIKFDNERVPQEFVPGLVKVRLPGRTQQLVLEKYPKITWFFDGAHTLESIQKNKSESLPNIERILIFNCTANRNGPEMLKNIILQHSYIHFDHANFCTNVTFTTNQFKPDLQNNTIKIDENLTWQKTLAEIWPTLIPKSQKSEAHIFPTIQNAINWVLEHCKENEREVQVLVTGSLHLVGGVMAVLEIDI
ncbi:16991_t:CDS:2, partial [Racocetra fulgida]